MCGITGIVDLKGSVTDLAQHMQHMNDAIRHRGPDGEGFLFGSAAGTIAAFGNDTPAAVRSSSLPYRPDIAVQEVNASGSRFVFGHRRLSIIDVSAAGHQPMCDPEKKIWITYNGEIYNHVELREELAAKGVRFQTQTDTEVLLQAYLHWEAECVNHFNGMWAFVIYDSRKNILFGSRDRTGVKPLYYYEDGNVFAFASEQKALLKLPFVKSGINFKVASQFLAGDIQFIERGDENMFSGIRELMPAHNFIIDLGTGTIKKEKYYSLNANTSFATFDETLFGKYREETEKLLVDSVKLRLRSDVPVGSCLSGGIDSSAIVGIMSRLTDQGLQANLGGKLKVFTLTFDDPKIDESKWAKYVVDQTRAEWHKVSPSAADLLSDLEVLNYAQDIPICSTGTYGQFRLMRAAKDAGIKVILDGQGGDELFGGYLAYSLVYWRELLAQGMPGKFLHEMSAGNKLSFSLKQLVRDAARRKFSSALPHSAQQFGYRSYFPQNKFLSRSVINEFITSGNLKAEQDVSDSSSLNEALLKDFADTRLKMYLKYEDRSSMWHSIEARTPFADDHRLTEYVFNLPGAYKIHNGINKHLLREAARNYLPEAIKNRKDKLGFVTPIDSWVKELKTNYLEVFNNSLQDFMDVKSIKDKPDAFFHIRNHADAVRVFRMVSFAVWKKKFDI